MSATRSTAKVVWGVLFLIAALIALAIAVFIASYESKTKSGVAVCPSLIQTWTGQSSTIERGATALGFCDSVTKPLLQYTAIVGIPGIILLLLSFVLFGTSRRRLAYYPQQVAPPIPSQGPPPAWYPAQGQPGWQRYWNGSTWTEDYRPQQ